MNLPNTLKSIPSQMRDLFRKLHKLFIVLVIVAVGLLFGFLFQSAESAELIVSLLLVVLVMFVILYEPLYGLLLWLFFTPFIETWVKIPLGAGLPDLSFSRFVMVFLIIILLAKATIGKYRFSRWGLTDYLILATTIGVMLSASQSTNPNGVIQTTLTIHFTAMMAFYFARNLVKDAHALHKLLLVVALFGFVASLYAIYEQATGNVLFLAKERSLGAIDRSYTSSLTQIRGLLGSSSNLGRLLLSTIPVSFYLFFESKSISRKSLWIGTIGVQFIAMFLTYNRASYIALLIALTLIQFFYPRFRRLFFLLLTVFVVVLWANWDSFEDSAVVTERFGGNSTLEGRQARWDAGFNMWQAKPITGWGFGRYETEAGAFRTDGITTNFRNGAIENDYLHILVGSGLVGFLPYALFLIAPLLNSLVLFFRARAPGWQGFVKPETIAVYWGIILGLLITSYSQIQTQQIVKMIPFAIAGAVVGTQLDQLRELHAKNKTAPGHVGTRSKQRA